MNIPEPQPFDLPDGRRLDLYLGGPDDGVPLVSHHGTPGAGIPVPTFVEAAADRGLRWVSYSRPGYGASTRLAGRTVADCAADVAAIVDHLGAERFYTIGYRTGQIVFDGMGKATNPAAVDRWKETLARYAK